MKPLAITCLIACSMLLPTPAMSAPLISGSYDRQGDKWVYSYMVVNDLDEPIYGFDVTPVAEIMDIVVPNEGWSFLATSDRIEFIAFDDGVSVLPGTSLGGFGFSSSFGPGDSTFAVSTNSGGEFNGTVVGPVSVPEASSAVLLAAAVCLGAVLFAVKKLHAFSNVK